MQQPAIQAALNNLVEAIRTALMAEFVEYSRGGDAELRSARKGSRSGKGKKKAPKKASAKKVGRASQR